MNTLLGKSASGSFSEEARTRQRATRARLDTLRRELESQSQRLAAAEAAPPRQPRRCDSDSRSRVVDAIRWQVDETATLHRKTIAQTGQMRAVLEATAGLNKARTDLVQSINQRVETSVENMEKVNGSVTAVERLLGLIEKLGLQTDLLSLNATIEAARAGVHGAGFGVVALEMRQLADRTASLTKQIYSNIYAMRAATKNTSSTLLEARQMGTESRGFGDTGRKNLADCIDCTLHSEELLNDFLGRARQQGAASVSLNDDRSVVLEAEASKDSLAQVNRETLALCLRVLQELQDLESSPVAKENSPEQPILSSQANETTPATAEAAPILNRKPKR